MAAGLLAVFVVLLCAIVLAAQSPIWPETGNKTLKKSGTVIDITHADQGYIMVKQEKASGDLKLRVEKGKNTLTYDLNSNGNWEVFPLQLGEGKYKVSVFKRKSGKKYASVSSQTFTVSSFSPEEACFLGPNQYVNYTQSTKAVAKAAEICGGLSSDSEKLEAVSKFVLKTLQYDYILALNVSTGYLPDLDAVLDGGKGICFDYAALTACMLRSQGIPTQLCIGYADKVYHAWNMVLIDGEWKRIDLTAESTATKVKKYSLERYY
ncbi:MAG: transglutaminase-like domain-containing protein [Clostridia bacterium]|nr:transglutaminase-like domain-containing protein [Clostridia bacterium]